jgi:hypothetical protein
MKLILLLLKKNHKIDLNDKIKKNFDIEARKKNKK